MKPENNLKLEVQVAFYTIISIITFVTATLSIFVFKDLTLFSSSIMIFALTYPLAVATGVFYMFKRTFSIEDQLGLDEDMEGMENMEEMMEDLSDMFEPVEDPEQEEEVEDDGK